VVLLALLTAPQVHAWGDTGHQINGETAFRELHPQARAAVRQLLERDPDFSLFSKTCTWSDHPRKRSAEHFVDLPRTAAQLENDPCSRDDICVVTAIDAHVAVLSRASASEAEKLTALKYLGYWVRDVHQPLPVSFKDDRVGMSSTNAGIAPRTSIGSGIAASSSARLGGRSRDCGGAPLARDSGRARAVDQQGRQRLGERVVYDHDLSGDHILCAARACVLVRAR
jgi:S1/P1 Nuclease